ncbi:SPFH domain-containing protein [Streptomyces sp. NPDC096319]|uniref:SPFH domain-containing protein n=1 Tax=Streptomyces sp. NPDC096319 TaxID=3366084 RepID=UPI00381B6D60
MTASTPNSADSGAAASRDAARTARRLTDGTLPRTSPPDPKELHERTPAPAPDAGPPTPTPTPAEQTAMATATVRAEPGGPEEAGEAVAARGPGVPVDGAPAEGAAEVPVSAVAELVAAGSASGVAGLVAPGSTTEAAPVPEPGPVPVAETVTEAEVAPVAEASPVAVTASAPVSLTRPTPPAVDPTPPVADPSPEAAVPEADGTAPAVGGGAPLDFGRIKGARVGTVAVPVAAVVRVARRKNVIGAETTGSIPVHLLFRDQPETAVPVATGDDGGPDTIAMAAPTLPAAGRKPAIPAPSKVQAPARTDAGTGSGSRPEPASTPEAKARREARAASKSRPAPTADPALVERPGPVLPGWVGVVAGVLAVAWCAAVVWWAGAVPAEAARMLRLPTRPYQGIPLGQWALLALGVVCALFSLGGLGRGRVGYAWVLTLFGEYRGTVRRTGLLWVSPLLLRRRVDVRLRHWRSEPLSAVDAKGTALDVTVLVVWRVRDTVRAALGVDGHEDYLREQVEAAMARVLSQLPADAFHEDAPTLRDAEAVGEALTRMLSAECAPVGVDVFSAQPTRIEYAPEVAAAMRRRRIAAIDAKHRDSVLTSVVDAVDDVVHRLTSRGLVELDDYERKALVKDLTVAFYTGRTGPVEGA